MPEFFNGSTPSFFSSTIDSFASFNASALCAGLFKSLSGYFVYGTIDGGSNMPSLIRAVNSFTRARLRSFCFR